MSLLEKVKELVAQKKMTIAELERKLDFSGGSISRWSTSNPSIDKVQKVADFFGVSIDYLLDHETTPDKHEQQALVLFRKETADMTQEEKERFNNALSDLIKTARTIIKNDK